MDTNSVQNPELLELRNEGTDRTKNCVWWKKRRTSEKRIFVVCILLLLICLALIVVNIVMESNYRKLAKEEASSVCNSKECITIAARILENSDPSADPCDDFYQFACGNYIQRHTVPDDRFFANGLPPVQTMGQTMYVTLNKLLEITVSENDPQEVIRAKHFHASCINTSRIEDGSLTTLMYYLNKTEFGEWPVLNPNWKENSADLERMIAKLFVHGVKPFFDISISSEDKHPSEYFLSIVVLDDTFENYEYFLNSSNSKNVQYLLLNKRLLSETLHLLGVEESNFKKDVEDMLNFEVEFAKIYENYYSSRDTAGIDDNIFSNKVNISILEEKIPEVKWSLFLDYIFNDFHLPKRKNNLKISLQYGDYMKNLARLIKKTSSRTVANYLSWKFVRKYIPYLSIRFRQLEDDYYRNSHFNRGADLFKTRWKECVFLGINRFGTALAFLYVKEDHQEEIEHEVDFIISSVKKAFIEGIHKQSWLDNNSKTICEEKVKAMGSKIGYPPQILDPSYLNAEHEGLTIHPDQFLENMLQMNRYDEYKLFRKLTGVIKEEKKNILEPLQINALHDKNIIYSSTSLLKTPLFNPCSPRYVNYGTFGVIVGHEITHGFDTGALDYDETVQGFAQWLPDNKTDDFKKQLLCYVEQYSQFPIGIIDKNIDGRKTLDQDLCDSSGVAQAFRAYRNYVYKHGEEPRLPGIAYSNEQVFFLEYAQTYCEVLNKEAAENYDLYHGYSTGKYRANGPLMNLPEFSNVFNCPVGSPMNPVKKCRLWN